MRQTEYCVGIVLLTCAVSGSVIAAEQDVPTSNNAELQEVIVTAQKRGESILTTPLSITALDGEALKNSGLSSAADLASLVPALQVNVPIGATFPVFSLRGVSQNDYSPMQSGPVATYVDEVYHGGPVLFSKQMYDLQRVEVLRGPQGTLYGKNATGGAINFVTAAPTFDSEGYLTVSGGSYAHIGTAGAYGSKLTDTVAFRIAFATDQSNGWQKNVRAGGPDAGEEHSYGVRLSLLFKPSDAFDATFRAATSGTGPSSTPDVVNTLPSGVGGGIYRMFNALYPASNPNVDYFPAFDWKHTATTAAPRSDSRDDDVALTMNWHVTPMLDVTSISAYSKGRFSWNEPNVTSTPLLPLSTDIYGRGTQLSQDLRIVSKSGERFDYIAGLYWSREAIDSALDYSYYSDIDFNGDGVLNDKDCLRNLAPDQLLYPYGCVQHNSYTQIRRSSALYGDGTFKLTPSLKLIVGVRYTRDILEVNQYSAWATGTDGVPLFNTIPGSLTDPLAALPNQSRTYSKPTGRIGLNYTTDDGSLLYGTLSRGYRTGAVNAAALNSTAEVTFVDPEVLDSIETGWKGTYLDHRLQLMGALFFYRYTNQQALSVDPQTFLQTAVSIAQSHVKGGEIELTARPWDALTVHVGVSHLDTEIISGFLSGVSVAGNRVPLAARWSGNASLIWDVLDSTTGKLSLFGAVRYTGDQYQDLYNDPNARVNPYAVVDGRLTYQLRKSPVSVALFGKNLTDKLYYTNRYDLASFGFIYDHVGTPRTYGAEVSYKF